MQMWRWQSGLLNGVTRCDDPLILPRARRRAWIDCSACRGMGANVCEGVTARWGNGCLGLCAAFARVWGILDNCSFLIIRHMVSIAA